MNNDRALAAVKRAGFGEALNFVKEYVSRDIAEWVLPTDLQ